MNKRVTTVINPEQCNGCGLCLTVCPSQTLSLQNGKTIVSGSESLGCGHCEAICPQDAIRVTGNQADLSFINGAATDRYIAPGQYDFASLICLMRSRRSCRNYKSDPVNATTLRDLVKIAITAPSGTNSQAWTFSLIDNRQRMKDLGEAVAGYFKKLNKIAQNPILRLANRIFSKGQLENYYRSHFKSVHKYLELWYDKEQDHLFHGATAAIIVGSKPEEASCPQDDALLATQNILLGAHAMGLGSCLIGFAVHAMNNDPHIKKNFGIPANEPVYSVIVLGLPAESYLRPTGRKLPLVRSL